MKTLDGHSRDPDNRRMAFILDAVRIFPLSKRILHEHIKDRPLINPENNKPYALATYNRDLDYMKDLGYLYLDNASRYGATERGLIWLHLKEASASQVHATAGAPTNS